MDNKISIIIIMSLVIVTLFVKWYKTIVRFEKHEKELHPNHFVDDIDDFDEKLDYLLKSNAAINLQDRYALDDYDKLKTQLKALFTDNK